MYLNRESGGAEKPNLQTNQREKESESGQSRTYSRCVASMTSRRPVTAWPRAQKEVWRPQRLVPFQRGMRTRLTRARPAAGFSCPAGWPLHTNKQSQPVPTSFHTQELDLGASLESTGSWLSQGNTDHFSEITSAEAGDSRFPLRWPKTTLY